MTAIYNNIPATTCTIDTSHWHKIRVTGLLGIRIINEWIRNNAGRLQGGFQIEGNLIRFEEAGDAVYFKLTAEIDNDGRRTY
jgi:hypothetical protein